MQSMWPCLCLSLCSGHPWCFVKHCCASLHGKSLWPHRCCIQGARSVRVHCIYNSVQYAWKMWHACRINRKWPLGGTECSWKPNLNNAVSRLHMVTFHCHASLENMVVTGFHMLGGCTDTRCCLACLSFYLKSIWSTNILRTAIVGESLHV